MTIIKVYIGMLIILSLILSGCMDRPEAAEGPITYKYRSHEFDIHYYFQEYESFIEQAKDETSDNRQSALFEERVEQALVEDGLENYDAMFFANMSSDLSAMESTIQTLSDDIGSIHKAIKQSLKESAQVLPSGDVKVYVLPSIPEEKAEMKDINYVTGYTNENMVILKIDAEYDADQLKYTVAHEYHHTVYKSLPDAKWETLLELTVMEGKADAFARSLYPKVEVPWTEPLEDPLGAGAWKAFAEEKHIEAYYTSSRFYGGDLKAGIPRWSLYKIGSEIVNSYIEGHPDVPVEEWTKMDADELFEESGLVPDS